ncbi:MAG: hypothetical protein H7A51_12550 [Akkermansiaceae bacterium]|nr:hypothetical protein [Akkermansiaceae bacterium]
MTALPDTLACAVCMGTGKDHLDSVAAGYAMVVMLVIIIPMLTAIIFFIARMAKRENDNLDPSLRD